MVTATTTVTQAKLNTFSLPSGEAAKQAGATSGTRFAEWAQSNHGTLESAQLEAGYSWLCETMEGAPDQHTLEGAISSGYDKANWLNRDGKRWAKEAYNAYWDVTDSRVPLLRLTVKDFRRDNQSWNGHEVISQLWDDAKGERPRPRPAAQGRRDRLERETRAYNAQVDAEERSRREASEAAERAEHIRKASLRWHTLPTTGSSPYITRKGLGGHDWSDVRYKAQEVEIALRNPQTGDLTGIQRIDPDGSKKQVSGSVKQGSCVFVTGVPAASIKSIVVVEGWASGASIALALADEKPKPHVVAAIDAGNLGAVYRALKRRYPKARITLAADDDRYKAQEVDAKGRPKPNTGQVKAHTLAMWAGAKVATPDFEGLPQEGKPTDFNDLHALGGLERVREQVLAARHADPMHAHKDTDTAALRRGIGLAKRYACPYEVDPGRLVNGRLNLSYRDFGEGVTCVRAAMGSGKTEMVAEWLGRNPGESFIAVTYLTGLTLDLARRFYATPYLDLRGELTDLAPHSAWCLNSLYRLVRGGRVRPVDTIFIDEIEPLLKRLTSRRNFENKRACIEVLEHLVRTAKRVVLADANLDQVTLAWIKRLRPHDAPRMVLSGLRPGVGRSFVQYEHRGDVRAFAKAALETGKHVYYAVNGLGKAREIHDWVRSLSTDVRTLLVCSDTAGEPEVQAFFADPNAESAKYDLIIASPSVSTGVSITNGHFDYVCGELGASVGTPKDGVQMLARVRGVAETHLWVDPQRRNNPTDRDIVKSCIWRDLGADAGLGRLQLSGEMELEAGYEALYLDVTTTDNKAANRYAQGVWRLVREDGFEVFYGVAGDDAKGIERNGKEAAETVRREKLEAEIDVTPEQAQKLEEQDRYGQLDQAGKARLERHRIKVSQCLPDHPSAGEISAAIELDDDGKLRRQLAHLEVAQTDEDTLTAKMTELAEAGVLPPDITRRDHWRVAFRATLAAAGIDPDTLESDGSRYDAADILQRWVTPLESAWAQLEVTVPGWAALEYAQAQPTKALGGALRAMFGLTHRIKGKKDAARYTVDAEPLEVRRNLIDLRSHGLEAKKGGDVPVKNNTATSPPSNISPLPTSPLKPARETTNPVSILPSADELPYLDDPEAVLRATIGWIGKLPGRPTPELVYEVAVPILAMSFEEDAQAGQYDKYRSRLLDGTPLESATPNQLRVAALAYYGWARDRQRNGGVRNRGAWAWQEAAEKVLGGYSGGKY